jgi:hypothetical protein
MAGCWAKGPKIRGRAGLVEKMFGKRKGLGRKTLLAFAAKVAQVLL